MNKKWENINLNFIIYNNKTTQKIFSDEKKNQVVQTVSIANSEEI